MINQGDQDDTLTWSFSPIVTVTAVDIAGPKKEVIHHWCHGQHPLFLRNKCSTKTGKDSNEDSEDVTIIVCDGCTYPINSSKTSYYECHPCKYFLHRYCAELPKQMLPYKFDIFHYLDDNVPADCQIIFTRISSSYLFKCDGCNNLKSGIHIASDDGHYKLDIGCAMLPTKIKHEAHDHPLTQACLGDHYASTSCEACRLSFYGQKELIFKCSDCFFYLHARCALKPHKLQHRWDPHPLTLITPEDIIEDHPHDFNCEHCSDDINTTYHWFYHCSLCDLSYHITCIDKFYRYSNIKFSASVEQDELHQKLHEHGLTLVLNKRKRYCGSCFSRIFYVPVLECTTCNLIICLSCVDDNQFDYLEDIRLTQ